MILEYIDVILLIQFGGLLCEYKIFDDRVMEMLNRFRNQHIDMRDKFEFVIVIAKYRCCVLRTVYNFTQILSDIDINDSNNIFMLQISEIFDVIHQLILIVYMCQFFLKVMCFDVWLFDLSEIEYDEKSIE